ncbi:phage tail tape measure protein [Neisseria dumasiana]|uniref:Phage tail tape measure protein domain-containing protein n=1 Tax=Neisseria dumasiana TaxID=1931275 RepID=A0A1X3DHX4_9NEIS|nr:phage tail tape measure protein [Neisseria dumasiana]OSI20404.1 hypothetical protein BV912_07485 [Neisseria dumasiana]
MKTSHELFVKITARADGVSMAFQRAANDTKRFSDGLNRLGNKSYFGRLISDLRKVREESRAAWKQMSTLEKTQHRMRQAGSIAAGATAAAWVLKEPAKKTMDYDRRLAHLVNVGYSDLAVGERIANKSTIDAVIQEAVRKTGAKRDNAIGAAENILAANSDIKLLKPVLETSLKGAVALDAEASDVSQILLSANKSMKIAATDFERALDIVTSSTGLGNFEADALARHLPQQMSLAANVFGTDLQGLNKLAALNQVVRVNAGNSDEAANNVVNILQKLTSADTKSSIEDAYKDNLGIKNFSLDDAYVKGHLAGKDKMQVFDEVVSRLFTEDKKSQKILAQIDKLRKSGQTEDSIYEAIHSTMEGSAIQTVLRDRQALFGYLAWKNNKSMYDDIVSAGEISQWALDKNFSVIKDTNSWKADAGKNEWEIATQKAFGPFNDALGTAAQVVTNFSQSFPNAAALGTGVGYTAAALGAAGVTGAVTMKGMGGGAGAVKAGGQAAANVAGKAAGSLFSLKNLFGAGLLFHSEQLNKGENELLSILHKQHKNPNKDSGVDSKRLAMGIGPEVGKQAGEAINQAGQAAAQSFQQAGEAVTASNNAVGQALIAQVGQTKIQGQINVSVTASPMLNVQTSAAGNNNTTLNVGKTNTGAK